MNAVIRVALLADMSGPYHRARHRTADAARWAGQPLTCATAHRAGWRRGCHPVASPVLIHRGNDAMLHTATTGN
jgi:hypothetical protein